jgi:hypothetical protein
VALPYNGYFDLIGGELKLKDSALLADTVDMWWILDSGEVKMRTSALNPTFPDVGNTLTRQGVYGWQGEYSPAFQLMPDPNGDVAVGIVWGYNGEFTGTISPSGVPPAVPTLTIYDTHDGLTATAVIQGSTAGAVNRVYVRRVGSTAVSLVGTITGDGSVTITPGAPAEYFSMCTSTLGGTRATIGNHFWVSKVSATRSMLREGGALAALELCKQFGIQVDLVLNITGWVPLVLWAMDRSAEDTVTIHGGTTGLRRAVLEIPRQIGFPPTFVPIQSYIVIPSGSTVVEDRYGIDNLDSVNDSIGIKSVFQLNLSRLDYDVRLGD